MGIQHYVGRQRGDSKNRRTRTSLLGPPPPPNHHHAFRLVHVRMSSIRPRQHSRRTRFTCSGFRPLLYLPIDAAGQRFRHVLLVQPGQLSGSIQRGCCVLTISQTTGSLTLDYDGGLCYDHAVSQGCARSGSKPSKAVTAAAVGGSLGAVAFILACATAYFVYKRRRAKGKSVVA